MKRITLGAEKEMCWRLLTREKMPLCKNLLISNVIPITSGFKLNSSLASIMSVTMKTQVGLLPYFPQKNCIFQLFTIQHISSVVIL